MGSLYLCSMPTFWSGAARLLDFGNTFDAYNRTSNGAEADGLGILWDWAMVGEDLRDAVGVMYGGLGTELAPANAKHELAAR